MPPGWLDLGLLRSGCWFEVVGVWAGCESWEPGLRVFRGLEGGGLVTPGWSRRAGDNCGSEKYAVTSRTLSNVSGSCLEAAAKINAIDLKQQVSMGTVNMYKTEFERTGRPPLEGRVWRAR